MADRKHIEYCIKLGNTIVGNKYSDIKQDMFSMQEEASYMSATSTYTPYKKNQDYLDFRARMQAWKNS